MPQMMPMNWLSLFIFFSIIFIMFNILNYFTLNLNNNNKNTLINKNNKFLNWKW